MTTENTIRRSPLENYLLEKDAEPAVAGGVSRFEQFAGVREEYDLLHYGVGIRDISWSGITELKGNDVLDFLHRITTNDLKELKTLEWVSTIFTSDKGRIIDSADLLHLGEFQLLLGSAERQRAVMRWIDKYVIMDDVHMRDLIAEYALLEVTGNQASSFLVMVFGSGAGDMQPGKVYPVVLKGKEYLLYRKPVNDRFSRTFILCKPQDAEAFITEAVDSRGAYDAGLVGEKAYEIFRIEQGLPAFTELNDEFNPWEAGLSEMVSLTKGCFIGQEVLARLDTYQKVQKELCGVYLDRLPENHGMLTAKDEKGRQAAWITSWAESPIAGKVVALAYLRKELQQKGTAFEAVAGDGTTYKAKTGSLPLA